MRTGPDRGTPVRALLPALAALAVFAAACGGRDASYDGASSGDRPGGSDAASGPSASDTVPVVLGEYFIEIPDTLPPGVRALEVTNRGMHVHDLWIRPERGDSALVGLDAPLDPGASRALPVELEPGRYYISCEVANHEGRGMYRTVVVPPPKG